MQMNTQSEMSGKFEPSARVPFLRESGPCEWPLSGAML